MGLTVHSDGQRHQRAIDRGRIGWIPFIDLNVADPTAIGKVTQNQHVADYMLAAERAVTVQAHFILEEPKADLRVAVVGIEIGAEIDA